VIPLILALAWPPFAAASLWYRGPRAGVLAMGLTAALSAVMFTLGGYVPAAAISAVWAASAVALWVLSRPVRPSRRERRYVALLREAALEAALDEIRDELDSTDMLVPVIKSAPRRVA